MLIPPKVTELAAGQPLRLIWHNAAGGRTYEVGSGTASRFVKWAPAASGIDLQAEAARMRWAGPFTSVPEVLGTGSDSTGSDNTGSDDSGSWLVTRALPGTFAVADHWKADPATAVRAIGEGLRAMHEALPAETCPFSWSAAGRVAAAIDYAAAGRQDPVQWHPVHQSLGLDRALELIAQIPPPDRLVVCHGDTCAPNTIIGADGRWSGHVDLGSLGVADRWADLAVATWSTTWNYGPGWELPLLDAYGIAPDPDRTSYYRLLFDLDPA